MSKLLLFNKPFGVLSQFTGENDQATLAGFVKQKGFYPAGRLDKDSEGLLLLTDDGKLQQKISDPKFSMDKTYFAFINASRHVMKKGDQAFLRYGSVSNAYLLEFYGFCY